MLKPQAVPRTYAASHCEAYAADLTDDERHISRHVHRCSGKHFMENGLNFHSCGCTAVFYFLEDAIELILKKLQEREGLHEVTAIGRNVREYSSGVTDTEP